MPPGLDPAAGDLKQARATRKRLQLFSMASVSMRMVLHLAAQRRKCNRDRTNNNNEGGANANAPAPLQITDFGAGSGHLGLILAWAGAVALGDGAVAVTLLDRKGFGCDQSERRVADAGLAGSVAVVEMDALEYASPVDLGVSLHSCGVLTDIAHQTCLEQRAAFVLCPCCYGQLNDMAYAGRVARPRSDGWRSAGVDREQCLLIASGADFSPQPSKDGKRAVWDFGDDSNYMLAKRAMQAIDGDRLAAARERGYATLQRSLHPVTCSPKNNLIIGAPIPP